MQKKPPAELCEVADVLLRVYELTEAAAAARGGGREDLAGRMEAESGDLSNRAYDSYGAAAIAEAQHFLRRCGLIGWLK